MPFLNRDGELDGRLHSRPYAEEVRIALSALDSILNGEKAVYASSELTTGLRLQALFRRHGVRTLAELRRTMGEASFRLEVWNPNVEEANALARELHHRLGGEIVITPAPFVSPGWEQLEYLAFWETVIRTRCYAVYFSDDWEHSSGCAFEYTVARDAGLPTFAANGAQLPPEEAADRLLAVVAEMEGEGFDAAPFREALDRLGVPAGARSARTP